MWRIPPLGLTFLAVRLREAEEFEEDHGVFHFKDFFNDFFMGVVRNPRLFHGILKAAANLRAILKLTTGGR